MTPPIAKSRRVVRPIPVRAKSARFTSSDLARIVERVLRLSDADETEVEIDATTDALTRFANNMIHQNVAEQTLSISVRTVVDGRTARVTTNKTDEESLRRAVSTAMSLARNEPKNPDLLPMLRQQKYQKVARFFAATAGIHAPGPRSRRKARLPDGR